MRIDQLIVGAVRGDAITEAALRLQWALRHLGPSEVYAMHPHGSAAELVHRVEAFPAPRSPADVLLYHVSIGEPDLLDFVLRRPERLVIAYHNITPARFFDDLDPHFASLLRGGRWQLRALAGRQVGAVADSEYNAAELRDLGIDNVISAPPPLNLGRLHEIEPDAQLLAQLDEMDERLVLVVGQLLPHKRPDLAVHAHHFLNVNHVPDARLVLAGPLRNPVYASALARHIWSLNLPTVAMVGELTDSQLAAYYRRADVVVVPSEHEGFGVPIVEAFSFGVPVVTRDFGAIAETAGGAALVLPATATAVDLAEATARVLTDRVLAAELTRRGHERALDFTATNTLDASLRAFASVLRNAPTVARRVA